MMGHIPEDENFEEYMNASAEEWSKPEETPPQPEMEDERVDRWGSPIPQEGTVNDAKRWGSEPIEPSRPDYDPQKKKSGTKWWIIAIVIVVVLCLCLCLGFFALSAIGVAGSWMDMELFQIFQ
jgi:hypothetical protein